jgi:hypothetical protein
VAVILLSVVTKLPRAPDIFDPWLGLMQRAIIVPYMLWLFAFATAMLETRPSSRLS